MVVQKDLRRATKIADGLTGADKKYDQVEPEKRKKKTPSIFPDPASAIPFKELGVEQYLLAFNPSY